MKSDLQNLQDYLDGTADAETAARVDAELQDPDNQFVRFLEGARENSPPGDPFCGVFDSPQTAPLENEDFGGNNSGPSDETAQVIRLGRPDRLLRRVGYGVCGTIAASLLVGAGVLIGSSLFRMEVLVATVTPDLGTARGPGKELRIEIQAGRPGFATLISLAPGRRQEVFPKPGSADFRLDESGSSTVGPLPPDTQLAVVVITETRSSDAVQKALSAKDYRAGDLTQLQPDLVKALSKRGDRWASIGISEFPRIKKP